MHISFLILSIPLLLLFSCGQKEKISVKASTPPPVCGEAANSVIMALKGQSSSNLDNSLIQIQKVDLNCVSKDGMSPLNVSVVQDVNANLLKILEKGAGVDFKNSFGETALHLAIKSRKNSIMIQYLLAYKADPNLGDESGKTPFHLAIQIGDIQAARDLLGKGASLKVVDKQKWTPLHFAANEAKLEMVEFLLGLGADRSAKNRRGQTPADLCQSTHKEGWYEVQKKLKVSP